MSDTTQTIGARSVEHDLEIRTEPFEVSPGIVAAGLTFGGSEVPEEMMSAVERIWQDPEFTWPTTLAVTAIAVTTERGKRDGTVKQVSRVSIVGTGFDPARPVSLSWDNATGFPGSTVELADVRAGTNGFFGVDVIVTTAPRRAADAIWTESRLGLVAQQSDDSGSGGRTAEQRPLPPHALWHWVR